MRRFFAERRRRRRENNTTSNNNSNTRNPSPPKQRRQELLNQPETMDNNNNNNNNNNANATDNNHNDSAEQIATELEHVEEQLHRAPSVATFRGSTTAPQQQQGGGGGRAAFESVATALASLRRRLSRSVASQRDNRGSTAATTAAAPNANNDNDTSSRRHSSLMQRLETAEMAHSNRIPLGILQQEMERRAQPMESVERRKSAEGGKLKQDTAEDTENQEPPPTTTAPQSSSDEGDDSVHSANSANSSIFGLPGSRRRRASTLMASRSRDEALQRASQDRQLHSLGNLESTASILPTVSEDDDSPSQELASTKKERFKDQGRNDDSLIPEETSKDLSTEDANDLTLLLTDRSQKQLARSSRSILLASTNSFATGDGAQLLDDTVNAVVETAPTSNTVVYSWGTEGAHSLHDTSNTRSAAPEHSKLTQGRVTRHTLLTASIGTRHSAVVTTTGQLLVCGANSHGQVDPLRKDEPTIVKPALFEFPSAALTRVTQVACGGAHTAAVTHTGTVMTWGQNDVGQLGHRRSSGSIPTAMSGPVASCRAAHVACGDAFTTVLTTRMQLYLCGSPDVVTWNAEAVETNQPPLPSMISSLIGVPLVQAVAGARHLIVVSAAGTAFCVGENNHGCCSRAFPKSIHTPVPVIFSSDNVDKTTQSHDESLALAAPFPHWSRRRDDDPIHLDKNIAVQDAACGDAFTLLLTQTGHVYVCGHNHVGQLGSSDHEDILTATLLDVPSSENNETVTFVSVAAGQDQSLLLDTKGHVWSMGQNQPLQVVLPGQHVQSIYAGGQECVAIAPTAPSRSASIQREFSLKKNSSDDEDMIMTETQTTKDEQPHHGELFVVEKLMEQQDKGRLLRRIHDFFSTPTVWNSLFWDPADCADLYDQLLSSSANNDKTKKEDVIAVAKAIEQAMLKGLESLQASEARLLHPESVRFLLLFLQCPLFVHPIVGASEKKPTNEEDQEEDTAKEEEDGYEFDARGEVALTLCESFLNLPFEGYKAIQRWAASCYGPKYFASLLVKPLIAMLERGLADGAGARSRVIPGAVTLLRWFHGSSQRNPSLASPSDFYSEAIGDMDPESLYEDLKKWKDNGKRSGTYFLSANTFLLSPTTKRTLLMIENQVEMLRAATSNLTWDREQHQFVFDPFFVLAIDREHMLTQTLQKISAASHVELRKSLKIVFKGEDAVDAGGVTKEFFHLLGHQLFDTSTGMWSTQYGDNVTWFNGDCTWNEDGFYLVGVLTGLSIYNDVMMDVHFPRVLYRKLLGYSLGLEDMVDEETKRGLQQLLDYEGDDVEDIFCLTFEHTWMDMGMSRSIELKEGGADIPVTSSNKEEYVLLYVKWLLVDSVSAQYDAFERGVMQVLESSSLDLLQPEELELLLVGSPDLDIDAWQAKTEYEGFEADSPVIKNFWKFVRNSSREEQLKLLKFATGTSRAPIGGLGAMIFKIQRAGADSDQLPTSHTCFNILIMPDYGENYEKLERLLGRAILECEGFGLQ